MEKLGRILLLILNIFIDTFLVLFMLMLILWVFGVSPERSIRNTFVWIQYSWDSLWEIESRMDSNSLSQKFQKRAHRHIYVIEPSKQKGSTERIISQPFK